MQSHQQAAYFVPEPSKWPAVGAVALMCVGSGAAFLVNSLSQGWIPFGIGIAILLYMLVGWFGDVIGESERGAYSNTVSTSFRWGMGWFIFSEVMFFAAFFGSLFYLRTISVPGLAAEPTKMLWPNFAAHWPLSVSPKGVAPYERMEAWALPAWNTLILLTSGVTLTIAHHALKHGKRGQLKVFLLLTVLLGALFLGLQAHEYAHAWTHMGLKLSSGVYGSTFYMMTGFHGMHVFVGALMLSVVFLRTLAGHFKPERHFAFEAAAWYWHFVDVVWLILFVFVYWI